MFISFQLIYPNLVLINKKIKSNYSSYVYERDVVKAHFCFDCATYGNLALAKIIAPATSESDTTWDMKIFSRPQCFLQG